MTALDETDLRVLAGARELAALDGPAIRALYPDTDPQLAVSRALGRAQWYLGEVVRMAERLAGVKNSSEGGTDAR